MEQPSIRAVEMVRAIRDRIYEETKDLSREELKEHFARAAAAVRQEIQIGRGNDKGSPGRENASDSE
jgi:hypothetical protein